MKRTMPKLFAFALTLAMIISFLPAQAQPVGAVSTSIVISQVYGGGGNSGATLKNDFIELYNLGSTAVDVTGWSVQYAATAGTSWSNKTVLLNGFLVAGSVTFNTISGPNPVFLKKIRIASTSPSIKSSTLTSGS